MMSALPSTQIPYKGGSVCIIIALQKEIYMSRLTKFLSLSIVLLFILACSTVTQPIKDVQNLAGTAESFATAIPVETLKAIGSQIPIETLEALPSAMPDVQALVNPQGTPVEEWKGIPVMS